MEPGIARLLISVGGLGLMLLAESLWPARSWRVSRLRRLGLHLGLAALNSVVLRLVAVTPLLLWGGYVRSQGWGIGAWLGLSGVMEILVSLVVLDAFDYWWHLANHKIPFLWRFHKVHHVDTHVDATTSLRFHPGELVISALVKASWILVWGPSVWAFALFEASVTLSSQFHHGNIRLPVRLERLVRTLIVTPLFHATHHTVTRRTSDANYATVFMWDRLFGTYQEPDEGELDQLGLERGRDLDLSLPAALRAPVTSEY